MAKKYNRQSAITIAINHTINYLYSHGFLHSLIWHTLILIFLALCYPLTIDNSQKISPISISFSNKEELVEPDIDTFPEIESIEISDIEHTTASSIHQGENPVVLAENEQDLVVTHPDISEIEIRAEDIISDNINLVEKIPELDLIENTDLETTSTKSKDKRTKSPFHGLPQRLLQNGNASENTLTTHAIAQTTQGEIERRLTAAGAQTGDIQISLAWNTIDDLDLHVWVNPLDSHISWMNRKGNCGGQLDVDMNFNPTFLNDKPVENVFWKHNKAPRAQYVIKVHYYMNWSRNREVEAVVLVKIKGKIHKFPVVVRFGAPPIDITDFVYQ